MKLNISTSREAFTTARVVNASLLVLMFNFILSALLFQ